MPASAPTWTVPVWTPRRLSPTRAACSRPPSSARSCGTTTTRRRTSRAPRSRSEPNGDYTEWTLKLRDGVTFGDGTPLTADIVKAHIERFLQPENASNFTAMVALIKKMDPVDDSTLVFDLSVPWGSFPYILAQQPGMVVNPEAIEEVGAKEFALNPPAGAGVGPYTVESYTPSQELVLKAKSDWWGGPVCIENLTMTVTVDGKTKLDSFNAGQLDGFITFDAPVAKQVMDSGDKFFVIPNPVISNVQILETEGATLADPKLRQALQQAMDLDSINTRIYAGVGVPTAGLGRPLESRSRPTWNRSDTTPRRPSSS